MRLSFSRSVAATLITAFLAAFSGGPSASAQSTPKLSEGSTALPKDYILLTIFLKHDQSKTLDQINKDLADRNWPRDFPPEGVTVESWYIVMGIGQVVTLRLPPEKLREVNRIIEQEAWGAYRTEFFPTYDYKEAARLQHEKALGAKP